MLKVTTTVTYKIPRHEYCQFKGSGMCRFVVPRGMDIHCALYDEPLRVSHGSIFKCEGCGAARNSTQNRIEDPVVDLEPEVIIKHAINEYASVYKQLRKRKYSEGMALTLAKEQVMETGW